MIIIEGADNAGKSSLAIHLSAVYKLPIHHAGGPPTSVEDITQRATFSLDNHDKFIFDRTPFISEPIYSVIQLRPSYLADNVALYQRWMDLQPILIFCRPPNSYLLDMRKHQIKDRDDPAHIASVMKMQTVVVSVYDKVMQDLPHLVYDYTKNPMDKLLKEIDNAMVRMDGYKNEQARASNKTADGTQG